MPPEELSEIIEVIVPEEVVPEIIEPINV